MPDATTRVAFGATESVTGAVGVSAWASASAWGSASASGVGVEAALTVSVPLMPPVGEPWMSQLNVYAPGVAKARWNDQAVVSAGFGVPAASPLKCTL